MIKIGSKVAVIFNKESTLGSFRGTVIHIPQDTGDSWWIQKVDGTIEIINPSSAGFDGIIELAESEDL